MLPNEHKQFLELVSELFALHGRNASEHVHKAWLLALKDRPLADISRVMRRLIEESDDLFTPSRVIAALREEKPLNRGQAQVFEPSKVTLLAARRHLEMFGEVKAREAFGDYAVNILKANPNAGYSAINPKTYGGVLPDHIKADLEAGKRHADGKFPAVVIGSYLPKHLQ